MKKATQQHTKRHNRDLVLSTVFSQATVSRAEIARITGLTRTTVSQIVAGLMDEGLVQEVGVGSSRGGKSPILMSVVADSRHLIGLDLAQDRFSGALVNLRGQIRQTLDLPVPSGDGDAALGAVYELLDGLIAAATRPLVGIGVGTPGLVDARHGVVVNAVNLNWRNLPLGQLLTDRYGLPASVLNDSQAAAIGEHTFGDGYRPDESLVVVNVGHGIGAGIILNGQLFHGDGGGAGEIGHVAVSSEAGLRCRCGNVGCLETLASTRALVERARAAYQARGGAHAARAETISFDSLVRDFEEADPLARQVVLEAGRFMGLAVSSLVGTLNVHRVVIAGEMARFGRPLLDAIRETVAQTTLARLAGETRVEFEHLGHNEIILGASALILRDYSLLFRRQRGRNEPLVERGPPAGASSSSS
ncbi:MAG: ROK family protein [Burkholderiales bacterium]